MGGESLKPPSAPVGAVFLSYASQDIEAARGICDALRAAGIEVWFDQSELRGRDAWDRQIRKEIHECALFIPLISQRSQERLEGYFRLEWKLAVDRSHRMAAERSFIVPVVVDSTREREALVPDSFRDVQWTHLPGGEIPPVFVERVRRLLPGAHPETPSKTDSPADSTPVAVPAAARTFAPGRPAVLVAITTMGIAKHLFALQDDITRAVAEALKTRLIPKETRFEQSDRPPSGNLDAYNALLEGKFYYGRFTEADTRKAIERFALATQLDPRYALAWSYVSRAWTQLSGWWLDFTPAQEGYEKAQVAAETALALAPDLASAHVARGFVLRIASFDWRGAEAEYRRALELAPADGDAKVYLADSLATFGQLDRAIELIQQALGSDPLHAYWYGSLGIYLFMANRSDEAEQAIRKAIELQPSASHFHFDLTRVEIQRGDARAALAAAQQEPPGLYQDAALALARQIGNDRAAADAALQNFIARDSTSDPFTVAQVYALRNDPDKTFEWLDRAWSYRDWGLATVLITPSSRDTKTTRASPRSAGRWVCRRQGRDPAGWMKRGLPRRGRLGISSVDRIGTVKQERQAILGPDSPPRSRILRCATLENNARRYTILAEKLEAARRGR